MSSLSHEAIHVDSDLNDVCAIENINYWNFRESVDPERSDRANSGLCVMKQFIILIHEFSSIFHWLIRCGRVYRLGLRYLVLNGFWRAIVGILFVIQSLARLKPLHFNHLLSCPTVQFYGSFFRVLSWECVVFGKNRKTANRSNCK